ncbi:MAG TPA: class I SAM-dependent methyltransferase [Candidatus Dormibacteraeota bacterium]|nr:class I SAM-dependent methyltransferase [Candidatus Dormibacteraeota bacterium]
MPEMSAVAKMACTNLPYRLLAQHFLVGWGLQGIELRGEALEIGSGSGAMAVALLKRFPELRVVATDYDPDMVRTMSQRLARFGDRATAQQADAANLPFETGRFDAVLTFAMLHHVGDDQKALAEAVRVLRTGGRLLGYDVTHAARLAAQQTQGHGHHGHSGHAGRTLPLEEVLSQLPIANLGTRHSLGGRVLRFTATKA